MTQQARGDDVDRIVAQWSRERPELPTDAMELFGRIYRIARLVGDQQKDVYHRHAIDRGELDVLAALRRAGEPFQLSPSALSESLMLTSGGMTGRLDRLERRGLVARTANPADRRALLVTLTNRGRALADLAVTEGIDAHEAIIGGLGPRQRAQLRAGLRSLLAAAAGGGAQR